eukprot:2498019-Prymnesium_polylepis.2
MCPTFSTTGYTHTITRAKSLAPCGASALVARRCDDQRRHLSQLGPLGLTRDLARLGGGCLHVM